MLVEGAHGLSVSEDHQQTIRLAGLMANPKCRRSRHRASLPPVALSGPALDGLQLCLGNVQEGPEELGGHPYMTTTQGEGERLVRKTQNLHNY